MKDQATSLLGFWERSPLEWALLALLVAALFAFAVFLIVAAAKILRVRDVPTPWGKAQMGDDGVPIAPDEAILHHRLFSFMDRVLAPGGISLSGSSDKVMIAETYLKIKFQVLREGLEDFFRRAAKREFDGISELPHAVVEMVERYEALAAKAEYRLTGGTICRLPTSFSRKFARWHKRHADQFFEDCESVKADRGLRDNRERAWLMAESMFFALRETIYDAQLALGDLNGDLDREIAEIRMESECEESA